MVLPDARSASTHILNLILILPVTALTLLLCLIQFIRQLSSPDPEPSETEPIRSVVPVISLFVGYTLTLPWLGFDVGTALFMAAFLWRREAMALDNRLFPVLRFCRLPVLRGDAALPHADAGISFMIDFPAALEGATPALLESCRVGYYRSRHSDRSFVRSCVGASDLHGHGHLPSFDPLYGFHAGDVVSDLHFYWREFWRKHTGNPDEYPWYLLVDRDVV